MLNNYSDHLVNIDGFNIVKPKTWNNPYLEYARIIMLIKTDIAHMVLEEQMESNISTIWIKLNRR